MRNNTVNNLGRSATLLAAFFVIAYSVFALLSQLKLLPYPYDLFWQFLPSLLLAFAFVITNICLHYTVTEEHKIYTAIASAFSILYCACVTIVYFTQMAVVVPALLQHKIDNNHLLVFRDGSYMVAVDCIGYAIMSLSTLFASFAFRQDSPNKWLYRSLRYHGLLALIVVASFFELAFLAIGALWMITFPMAMINAAKLFSRETHKPLTLQKHEAVVLQKTF